MSPLPHLVSLSFFFFLLFLATGVYSVTFTVTNNCDYTVWPGILSGAGKAPLATTGFALPRGESKSVDVPATWSGRLWGRTHCSTDPATGGFTCATGDCGSSSLQCAGGGAVPPATLAEFTLGSGSGSGTPGLDFYDVSLVDGYNLPMLVAPSVRQCGSTGCLADLNPACPAGLRVVSGSGGEGAVACRSACEAFGSAEYCCRGEHGSPGTCRPSAYSRFFKEACPRAYSYAYDDATSTFTCGGGGDYAITFCPSSGEGQKSPRNNDANTNDPEAAVGVALENQTMVYFGGGGQGSVSAAAAPDASPFGVWLGLILGFVLSLQ